MPDLDELTLAYVHLACCTLFTEIQLC